jgi:quinol---cytochrome c reductase iron-sulfur subunit, bacillus type
MPIRMSRRTFAILVTQAVGAGFAAMYAVPAIGWLFEPLRRGQDPVVWRRLGPVGDLEYDVPTKFEVRFPAQNVWTTPEDTWIVFAVRYRDGTYRFFSNVCTHMQCPVRWQPKIQEFLCPCHGGLYDLKGQNIGGPPPEPLPQWRHYIDASGVAYVANQFTRKLP